MRGWKMAALAAALTMAAGAGAALTPAASAQDKPAVAAQAPRARAVQILAGGSRIGVSVRDLEDAESTAKDAAAAGVIVEEVSADGPAEKAGIQKGDRLVEFDGERVRSARQLTRLVQETPAGRSVSVALLRGGQRTTVTVTPASGGRWSFDDFSGLQDWARDFRYRVVPPRPAVPPRPPAPPTPPVPPEWNFEEWIGRSSRLGVTLDSLSPQLAEYFGARRGALVTAVTGDSAAAKAGLKAGDVITSVNGSPVESPSDVRRRIQELNESGEFTIEVLRDKKPLTLKGKAEGSGSRRTNRTIL